MPLIARSPIDVMLGEMAFDVSNETRYADLQAIASVISNRSTALGVTPQQVVANQGQFGAYGKGLPPGASAFRDLAQAAWDDVTTNGPTHAGTFYATPSAVNNLPSGLNQVASVPGGHQYFEDPQGRAIMTSVGNRAPTDLATVRAAAAQRQTVEVAQAEDSGMPTPQQRPDILNITQNPALLAGTPLVDQVDPNFGTGIPSIASQTRPTDLAIAQQMQPSDQMLAEQQINSPQALQAAMSNLAQGMTAQRAEMPTADVAKSGRLGAFDMARFGNEVGPVANVVKTVSTPPQINTPQALAAELGSFPAAMTAQRQVAQQFDPSRFGNPASQVAGSNFGAAMAAQRQAPVSSFDEGRFAGADMPADAAMQDAMRASVTGQINTPAGLAAALGSFPGAMAAQRDTIAQPEVAQAAATKSDRIGAIDTSGMDQSRFSAISSPEALQAAIDGAKRGPVAASNFSMADNALQAAIDRAAKGPAPTQAANLGVNSPEHQAMAAQVEKNLQAMQPASDAANAVGQPVSFERDIAPMQQPSLAADSALAEGMAVARTVSTPTNITAEAPTVTPDAAAKSAMSPQQIAGYQQAAKTMSKAGMLNIGQQPPTNLSGELPANFDVLGTAQSLVDPTTVAEDQAPALETVTVPDLPSIAAPTESAPVTNAVPTAAKNMPAVQTRQSSAMDVWNGKANTGIATDGSTVSRMEDGKIGRYVPEYNHTLFSTDDGATWSSPVKGNALASTISTTAVAPAIAASRPGIGSSLIDSLMGILSGTAPQTGVSPAGTVSTSTSTHDGATGSQTGGGAGGYGTTQGVDPEGTY